MAQISKTIAQIGTDGWITKTHVMLGKKTLGRSSRTAFKYWLRISAAALKNGAWTGSITSETPMTYQIRFEEELFHIINLRSNDLRMIIDKIISAYFKNNNTGFKSRNKFPTVWLSTPWKWIVASPKRENVSKLNERSELSLQTNEWPKIIIRSWASHGSNLVKQTMRNWQTEI